MKRRTAPYGLDYLLDKIIIPPLQIIIAFLFLRLVAVSHSSRVNEIVNVQNCNYYICIRKSRFYAFGNSAFACTAQPVNADDNGVYLSPQKQPCYP